MDMDKLLALRTLAEEGTQIRAAEKLFCTQSALSKQINTLERELDCRLFDRKGSRLCSTTADRKPTPTPSPAWTATPGSRRSWPRQVRPAGKSCIWAPPTASGSTSSPPCSRRPNSPCRNWKSASQWASGPKSYPCWRTERFPWQSAPGGGRKTARRLPGSSALSRGNGPGTAPGPPSCRQIRPLGGHMPPHHAGAGAGLRHPAVYRRADENSRRGRPSASGLRQHRGHQAGGDAGYGRVHSAPRHRPAGALRRGAGPVPDRGRQSGAHRGLRLPEKCAADLVGAEIS